MRALLWLGIVGLSVLLVGTAFNILRFAQAGAGLASPFTLLLFLIALGAGVRALWRQLASLEQKK